MIRTVAVPDLLLVASRGVCGTVVLLGLLIGAGTTVAADDPRTDLVVTRSGNEFTCSVKFMQRGLLEVRVDDIDNRLRVKWRDVLRLTTSQYLEIGLEDGSFLFGSLVESEAGGVLRVQGSGATTDVPVGKVRFIEPLRRTFWEQHYGDLSTGLNYANATEALQFNIGGSLKRRTTQALIELSGSSNVSDANKEKSKTNADLTLQRYQFLRRGWFLHGVTGMSRNDELGMRFRAQVSGGGGRAVINHTDRQLLLSSLLSANRELTSDGRETNNLEAVLASRFETYRYETPKLELATDLLVFLNLTTAGRYRVTFDARVSLEIVKDFFWDVGQVYYRYDSDPSEDAFGKDDFGIVTGLRYRIRR